MSKTGKTLFVDFKNKKLTHIQEGEEIITPPPVAMPNAFDEILAFDFLTEVSQFSSGLKTEFSSGLKTDPSLYIENSIQTFEKLLDEQGLFDQRQYKNKMVLADAKRVFSILQREIPMLQDVMENLKDMIEAETGYSPAFKKD